MNLFSKFMLYNMLISVLTLHAKDYRICNMSTANETLTGYPDWWYYDNYLSFNIPAGEYQDFLDQSADIKGICYSFGGNCPLGNTACSEGCTWGRDSTGDSSTFVYGVGKDYEGWAHIDEFTDCADAANQILQCQNGNYSTQGSSCDCPTVTECNSIWSILACNLGCLFASMNSGGSSDIAARVGGTIEDAEGGFKKLTYKNGDRTIRVFARKRSHKPVDNKNKIEAPLQEPISRTHGIEKTKKAPALTSSDDLLVAKEQIAQSPDKIDTLAPAREDITAFKK